MFRKYLVPAAIIVVVFGCATMENAPEPEVPTESVPDIPEPEQSDEPAVLMPMLDEAKADIWEINSPEAEVPELPEKPLRIEPPEIQVPDPPIQGTETSNPVEEKKEDSGTVIDGSRETSGEDAGESFLAPLFSQKTEFITDKADKGKVEEPPQKELTEDVVKREPEAAAESTAPPEKAQTEAFSDTVMITAEVRELFTVRLEPEGWLLEGITDVEGKASSFLRYNGREYTGGGTVFTFYPFEEGSFIVSFRRTDNAAGKVLRSVYEVNIISGMNRDEAPDVSEEEAEEQPPAAPGEAAENTVSETDIDSEEQKPFVMPETAEELIALAAKYVENGKCGDAARLLKRGVEQAQWNERDLLYFTLGDLYQNCREIRDERKALEYYRKIVNLYPVSNYWEESRKRMIYIERTYIHIR